MAEDIATESRDLKVRNEIGVNEDEEKALTEMKETDNRVIRLNSPRVLKLVSLSFFLTKGLKFVSLVYII